MRKIFVIIILVAVSAIFMLLKGKGNSPVEGDSIKISSLYLHPTTNPGSTFNLLDPYTKLSIVFGSPLNVKTEFSEMYDGNVTQYEFEGVNASYFEGHAISNQIKKATVSLGIVGAGSIKIGDSINKLEAIFPNSLALKKDGQIFVSILTPSGEVSDSFLVFDYDANNVVTSIIIN